MRSRSINANFLNVVATLSLASLSIEAAYKLIMGFCRCIAIPLCTIQDWTLLMLHWHSLLEGSTNIAICILPLIGGQYCDYGLTTLHGPLMIQNARQKLLTLHWHTFVGESRDIVTSIFTHNGGGYIDHRLELLHSPVIIQDVRQTTIDTLLMLIFGR